MKGQPLAGSRVIERQRFGMEHLAACPFPARRPGRAEIAFSPPARSVERVSQYRIADKGQMNPDLVGAARSDPDPQPGKTGRVPLPDLPFGHGRLAPGFRHRHFFPVYGVAPDRPVNAAGRPGRVTPDQRPVLLGDGSVLELGDQVAVRPVILGHGQQSRGILVQAVDNPRAEHAADARQVPAVVEQGVDQGSGGMARGGMHHQAGRFVDYQKVRILPEDDQGYRLGFQGKGFRNVRIQVDPVSGFQAISGLGREPVNGHAACFNPFLKLIAGFLGSLFGQIHVQAFSGILFRGDEALHIIL